MTIEDAARQWVKEFSCVPRRVAELLLDEMIEVTPPVINSRVCLQ